jgi:predicted transcriptional regulator
MGGMARMIIKLRSFLATMQDEGYEVPSIPELAEEIGVSKPHMYKIAAGKTDFKVSAVRDIITAMRKRGFKMDIGDLLEYRET